MKLRNLAFPLAFAALTAGSALAQSGATPVAERLIETTLGSSLDLAPGFETFGPSWIDRSFHAPVRYFETTLSYGQNTDPQNLFLLVNGYLGSNQQEYGIEFLEKMLDTYGEQMSPEVRAHHMAAYAIMRATYADDVPLMRRIGWVNDTFDILEEAKALTKGEDVLVRWASGIIYTQVPGFFFKFDEAMEDLNWLVANPEKEPLPGFYREVFRHLSVLHDRDGNASEAARFAKMSGYGDNPPEAMFMNWFSVEEQQGTQMGAYRELNEVIPGKVFSLFGFGFSDVHFVLSDDGSQLIAVDAGTHPQSLREAHEMLLEYHPDLPKIGTMITTHAHWDHIGGFHYLKEHNPNITIMGRENYHGTLDRVQRSHSYHQFRGAGFSNAQVADYHPDVAIDTAQFVTVGGSRIELIPQGGGETEDALLVYFTATKTLFVGDVLMPYYGEPWVEEGSLDKAVTTMEAMIARNPDHILHGHRPLTMMYTPEAMPDYLEAFNWLVKETRKYVANGYSVKDVIRMNLVPPGFSEKPNAYLAFLASRDHVIGRAVDGMVGIWREDRTGLDPEGLDVLTNVEYGRMLDLYLDLSPKEIGKALNRMVDAGDNELAFKMALAARQRFGDNAHIDAPLSRAADQLRVAAQFFDPFKLTAYSEMSRRELAPMTPVVEHRH
ncbi:MAG: MBL fold metallo-hydrolase [Thalassovita sp.]